MNNTTIAPRWDLSSIYSDFNGTDYKIALSRIKELTHLEEVHLKSKLINDNFSQWLYEWIKLDNELGSLYETLTAYAEAISTTDTTDSIALNNISILDEMGLSIGDNDRIFSRVLSSHQKDLHSFYTSFPHYKDYEFIFNEKISENYHLMTIKEENLSQDLQRTGGDAWSRLQQQIISNLTDTETGKTFNELRNEAYSSDRQVRKTAYEKEVSLLKQAEIPLAACLNNLKGATLTLNKRRNWKTPIERSLFSSRMSNKTLSALIESIEESLPFWREYLCTKAKILRTGNKCDFYDLFAPISDIKAEKCWSFNEAKQYIIEKFASFSKDMGTFAQFAFDNNWIDAEIRKGKVGGAYCTSFPTKKESRVLTNFSGTFSDVLTLSHELGHSYHSHCLKDTDYALTNYPMTLAETASIFAETIVMKDMLSKSNNIEHAILCETHLSDSCQVLVDILSRYYFEKSVFDEKENNELNAEMFCQLMIDAQNKSYGTGLSDIKHPYMWALKCHYYSPDFDFYNFPYAFGQLFGLALYAKYLENKETFPDLYKLLLISTGKKSCEEVCKEVGFDIETKEFWKAGIDTFIPELNSLKNTFNISI